jgi:glyoxylase-like metal-dependent hydrolase (beta-lactamase superfamily II)
VLRQVAEGVLIHQSELLQNNAVVVHGRAGVLLIDPGIKGDEMACLAGDLSESGQPVVAGFSTHPDWDHVLWHAKLGEAPRYGTARCAAYLRDLLSDAGWKARVAEGLPPEIADEVPLDLFGLITGLPAETARIPWDGPQVRIVEHPAHAPGHAALLIERDGHAPDDPRIGPSAKPGWEWVSDVHNGQAQRLARRSERDRKSWPAGLASQPAVNP